MRAILKLTWVEIKLFLREPINAIFTFALPFIFLFVMGEVFGKAPATEEVFRGFGAMNFYVPAYIALVIASTGLIGLPVHLAGYREQGFLRRLRASSLPSLSLIGAQAIVSFIVVLLCCILLVVVAFIYSDVDFPQSPALLVAAFTISVLSFTALGFFLGALLPTTRAAQIVGLLLFFVMFILSGGGPPPEVMSSTMQWIGKVMPLTHVVILLQDLWNGLGWNWGAFLIIAGVMLIASIISFYVFRWE